MQRFFAYGSLMYEPEYPDALLEAVPAHLYGLRRAFNQSSRSRGCSPSESAFPELSVPDSFVAPGLNRSLVLGTEPGNGLDGILLSYGSDVLAAMDRREGYRAEDPHAGYLRTEVTVSVLDTGESVSCWTYLTNPLAPAYVGHLDPETIMAILLRATPSQPVGRACGLAYLTSAMDALAAHGLSDAYLSGLFSDGIAE